MTVLQSDDLHSNNTHGVDEIMLSSFQGMSGRVLDAMECGWLLMPNITTVQCIDYSSLLAIFTSMTSNMQRTQYPRTVEFSHFLHVDTSEAHRPCYIIPRMALFTVFLTYI